jgi:hypothetical protein
MRQASILRLSAYWLIVFLILPAGLVSALHDPGDGAPLVDPGVEAQAHARVFYDAGDIEGMGEYLTRYESDRDAFYYGVTFGGYYRLVRNLKLGAFYRLQLGARHDEDWVESGSDWVWADTGQRLEHVFMLDAAPRFLLDFLPGRNWVFAVKNRYELTVYNHEGTGAALQSLLVRPGLTYFWMVDREPVINISLQYATYWSLNFGERPWYRHGPYLNVLYHLTPRLKADVGVGTQWVYWSESSDFDRVWPNNGYAQQVYRALTLDFGVIYVIDKP